MWPFRRKLKSATQPEVKPEPEVKDRQLVKMGRLCVFDHSDNMLFGCESSYAGRALSLAETYKKFLKWYFGRPQSEIFSHTFSSGKIKFIRRVDIKYFLLEYIEKEL